MASKHVLGAFSRASMPAASSSRVAYASSVAPVGPAAQARDLTDVFNANFPPLQPVPAKKGVHVATLHMRSYASYNLDMFSRFALHAAESLKIPTSGTASLPKTRELVTVIRSPFVMKKSQENFDRKTHRRAIKVFDADREVVDLWLRYLKQNSIGGVGLKAYLHEYVDYGFARDEMTEVEGVLGGASTIKAVAADLLKSLSAPELEEVKPEIKAPPAKKEEVKAEKVEEETAKEVAKEEVKEEVKAAEKAEAKEEAKTEAAAPATPKA